MIVSLSRKRRSRQCRYSTHHPGAKHYTTPNTEEFDLKVCACTRVNNNYALHGLQQLTVTANDLRGDNATTQQTIKT